MEGLKHFRIVLCFTLLAHLLAIPLSQNDKFCTGQSWYNNENGKQYIYNYETDTTLWINDVSDDAKSVVLLKSTVMISPIGPCTYMLKLSDSTLTGESLNQQDSSAVLTLLNTYGAVFRLNQQGELDTEVRFQPEDQQWSRNIKRGIISAFQVKPETELRELDHLTEQGQKSATLYETDVLGRCRTTYRLDGKDSNQIKLNKVKSLQRCTLNENSKTSAIQYVPYISMPEFFQGRLFVEDYECNTVVQNGLLNTVVCKEVSTYKIGSRGRLGAQAVVNQRLTYKSTTGSSGTPSTDSWQQLSIRYEYDNTRQNILETENFDVKKFTQEICDNSGTTGLTNEHSNNFRDLVMTVRGYSTADLLKLYQESQAKCSYAGLTVSQALLFADTDNSFEAVLSLMDQNVYDELRYITEYPLLTALARNQNPSENLINRLKTYLSSKQDQFQPLNKLYLIYSTLIKTFCTQKQCTQTQLESWSSIFTANLANDCDNKGKKELVVSSLKAIGNIGYFGNSNLLASCAFKKDNSLEIRVNAIQALRRFPCDQLEGLDHVYTLLQNQDEDTELRINSFLTIMRCSEQSQKFEQFAQTKLADFLLNEQDIQLLTYVIDYGKEHGLTTIFNAVLNDPRIKEKFTVNFKEMSWNNYQFKYNVMRDSAIEVETSVIYTPKTFIPRSIKLNVTTHMFGMSVNFLEANIRLEGLDEILKASIIDKLKSEKFMKRIMQKPEQLIDILNIVADKLKYVQEKPQISIGLRVYGSEVFYSRLDNADELKRFAEYFRSPRENLYNQVMTIRNMYLVDLRFKQPLMNGLEFATSFDISAGMLINKASTRQSKNQDVTFDVNNFYSASLAYNRKYEVLINNDNKLSLKKKSFANGGFRLDVEGTKQEGSAVYNMNLRPMEMLPLLTIDGRFYKLSTNSQYREVKDFKIEQVNYDSCTSERFETAFGVNMCLSVQRPKVGVRESLRYLFLDDIEQSMSEDDGLDEDEFDHNQNDGHDHTQSLLRPSLLLSGPYRYQLMLKNPELIKTITLTVTLNKDTGLFDFKGGLTTKTQTGQVKKTLDIVYLRESKLTNRGLTNTMNLELRRPQTNEIRFQGLFDFAYQQDEVLAGNMVIDNKIGREFLATFNFARNKTVEGNIIPSYYIDGLLNSKLMENRRYRLHAEVNPNGKDIQGTFYVDVMDQTNTKNQNIKIINADLSMNHNEQSESDLDYQVQFKSVTSLRHDLKVNGRILASLLHSDFDLSMEYSCPTFTLQKPATIKMGHKYDGAADAKSYVEFHVNIPQTPIELGSKLIFNYNLESKRFEYVEIQIDRPRRPQPVSVFYGVKALTSTTNQYELGIRNAQIDLTQYNWFQPMIQIDDQNTLTSFVVSFSRNDNKSTKKITTEMTVQKNDNVFVNFGYSLKGDLKKIRESTTEIGRQTVSGEIFMKMFDWNPMVSGQLEFESSVKNNKHEFIFTFENKGVLATITKVESINSKLMMNKGQLDAQVEVVKVEDKIKSYKLTSKGNTGRVNGDMKEFDISYEKVMTTGEKIQGNGIVRYNIKDFKNFETSVTINGHYESKISMETRRTSSQNMFAYHNFRFSNKHLDGGDATLEREFNILIDNRTTSDKFIIDLSLKRGPLNSIGNRDQLDLCTVLRVEKAKTSNLMTADLKSTKYNIDMTHTSKWVGSVQTTGSVQITSETQGTFPAIMTDGLNKVRKMTHKLNYLRSTDLNIKNTFETDSRLLIQKMNFDLTRKVNGNNVNGQLNMVYRMAYDKTGQDKQLNADWQLDSTTLKANLKQNRFQMINSMFKAGQKLDVSDCTFNGKYNRQNSSVQYILEGLFDLQCKNKRLMSHDLSIRIAGVRSDAPSTVLKLSTASDIYYPQSSIQIEHQKFTRQNGLIKVLVQRQPSTFSEEFSYTRTLDRTTQKMEQATYRLITTFPGLNSNCEMNFEAKTDFINQLNCKMQGDKIWGYYLKLDNQNELLSGKRGMQFDLTTPQRKMRVAYNGYYATPIDGTDDDQDSNDEREFNGTATFQWDLLRQPNNQIVINLKRDNIDKKTSMFFIDVPTHPRFNLLRFEIMRIRSFNQTTIKPVFKYQLKNGQTNQLDMTIFMGSDIHTNSLSFETNLVRPAFNTLYENRFCKQTGRLQYLGVRLGKMIKLVVDKESDPQQRKIFLELVSPDVTKYTCESTTVNTNNQYVVKSTMKQGTTVMSEMVSTFDSDSNRFNVKITGNGKIYTMNFGVFNETLMNVYLVNESEQKVLGLASLGVLGHYDGIQHNDLVMSARWNRFWYDIQSCIMGGQGMEGKAIENAQFNSYFGDIYAVLSGDLKEAVDGFKQERMAISRDLGLDSLFQGQMEDQSDDLPLYKRFFRTYNVFAHSLSEMSLRVRPYSRFLSTLIPRLPTYEYNNVQGQQTYENNLVLRRPTLNARNLYQFNAEYRNYLKQFSENVLFVKSSLSRNTDGMSIKALINKYKYRSLDDYTLVGNVFNRRNIIGFDGEQTLLQSKCRYLLAHETHKNRFSVVLNFNDSPYIISVFAYGQKPIDIGYNKVAIDSKSVSIPQTIMLGENGLITVTKTNVGVCVEVNSDLKVCCYEDSMSCTIATTRWFTGKLNGILGNVNKNVETVQESQWYLDNTCSFPNKNLLKPNNDVVKQCYSIFGKQSRSLMRDAMMAIRPTGWQRMCESALTADPKAKCTLLKAFDHFADEQRIDIEPPSECYTCDLKTRKYTAGETVISEESRLTSNFEKGTDYVFMTLPCDKKQFSVDFTEFVADLKAKNPSNRYYVVSVDENDASIYQSSTGELYNFDLKNAYATLSDDSTSQIKRKQFTKGLFLAGSLFSRRLVQNRFLIIRSCGNCLPYNSIDAIKFSKLINQRNVVVHSWGDYEMKNLEGTDEQEIPVGYSEEDLYMYKPSEQKVETDNLDSYKIEHKADMCQRLAIKTKGSVMNIKQLRNKDVMSGFGDLFQEKADKTEYEYKINKCQKLDTPFGDITDFSYNRMLMTRDY